MFMSGVVRISGVFTMRGFTVAERVVRFHVDITSILSALNTLLSICQPAGLLFMGKGVVTFQDRLLSSSFQLTGDCFDTNIIAIKIFFGRH